MLFGVVGGQHPTRSCVALIYRMLYDIVGDNTIRLIALYFVDCWLCYIDILCYVGCCVPTTPFYEEYLSHSKEAIFLDSVSNSIPTKYIGLFLSWYFWA